MGGIYNTGYGLFSPLGDERVYKSLHRVGATPFYSKGTTYNMYQSIKMEM